MNREQVVKFAREANITSGGAFIDDCFIEVLNRFANLVEQRYIDVEKDAARWRFTEHKDYFEIVDWDSSLYRWRVGLRGKDMTVNQSIMGYGKTRKQAVTMALKKLKKEKRDKQNHT